MSNSAAANSALAAAAIANGFPVTVVPAKGSAKAKSAALAPAPAENAPVAENTPKLFAGGVPLSAVITSVAPNPKKPGSAAHARYALYPAVGATLADALKAGVRRDDFLYDVRKGYLKVEVA